MLNVKIEKHIIKHLTYADLHDIIFETIKGVKMTPRKKYNTQMSVPIEVGDKNTLEFFAELQGTTVSQLVRVAVKSHLNKLVADNKVAYDHYIAKFKEE